MAIAEGRITRPVTFGSAGSYIDGSPLGMIVKLTPKRSLVWQGAPQVRRTYTARAEPGLTGSVAVPVTDQEGYTLGDGTAVVPGEFGHVNAYDVVVDYFAEVNSKDVLVPSEQVKADTMVVPTGDLSPMDLDTMLVSSTWGGLEVALPDWITPAVDAATLAAAEATAAVATIGGKLDADDLDEAAADLLDVPDSALTAGVNASIVTATEPLVTQEQLDDAVLGDYAPTTYFRETAATESTVTLHRGTAATDGFAAGFADGFGGGFSYVVPRLSGAQFGLDLIPNATEVVDHNGAPVTGLRLRVVLDPAGQIDDLVMEAI